MTQETPIESLAPQVDLTGVENLLQQNAIKLDMLSDQLSHIYAAALLVIGVTAAVLVCVLLYKFLRKCY